MKTNDSLTGQKFHLKLTDLGGSDTWPGELTTVLLGQWKTSFKLDFKNYSNDYQMNQEIKMFDYNATLKTVSVSPISVALKLESPLVEQIVSASNKQEALRGDKYWDSYSITINYKDGTSEVMEIFSGMHHLDSNGEMLFIKTFDSMINDKEIKSITFFGREIQIVH